MEVICFINNGGPASHEQGCFVKDEHVVTQYPPQMKRVKLWQDEKSYEAGMTCLIQILTSVPPTVHRGQRFPHVSTVLESRAFVSYSRPATAGDNPVNESFFSRLKAEWGEMFAEAKTFEALQQPVSRAMAYYKTERYHTSIGCQTPAQSTQQCVDHLTLEGP